MYGTLGHFRIKAQKRDELTALYHLHNRENLFTTGAIGSLLYSLDNDPDRAIMVVAFDSRKAYQDNAQSPGQNERYRQYRALLESEPEWHDGEITPFFALTDWHNLSQLYGTVARFSLKPGADSACEEFFSHWRDEERTLEVIPGAVGTWLLRPDDEPAIAYAAVLFESKRTYVDNAASAAQDLQYRALREWLTEDPEWFDGRVAAYHRF